jgi:hypothetical protein
MAGTVRVEHGQRVRAEDAVASTDLPGDVQTVNVVRLLGIDPQDLERYMRKREGDPVQADEVIAESRGLLGLFGSQARSPVQGTIENISTITGQVLIRQPPTPVEVHAYVDGVVREVLPQEGAVVECSGALVQGILGLGGETMGELATRVSGPDEPLTADALDGSCRGKVVIGGSAADLATLHRAQEVRAAAIVVGGIEDEAFEAFLGRPLGVAITGHEDLGLTLILTEGFGRIAMADRTFGILRDREGRRASANGTTQIRAGVIRPEVIVVEAVEEAVREEPPPTGLEVGALVRVIRAPYFGRLATVTALPEALQELETEAKVRVLQAKLDRGENVTLPRANVELIQL